MIDTLSAFNLGSKVEILKLDDKGNTNIKGNGNNFKNYLKKEVSNTSEDKNNILNHRNDESDINTNYIEDEIIDIDLCFEISEKIEKFLDSKELDLKDLNLQDLNFEELSEELKDVILLLLNISNINLNKLSNSEINYESASENLINHKPNDFKNEVDFIYPKSFNISSLDSNFKLTLDNSEVDNIKEIKNILKDINGLLIEYLDANLNKDTNNIKINNIKINNIVNDVTLNSVSEELLNDLKKLIDIIPKNILKDIDSKLDSNPKKEILNLLISEIENEKKNIVIGKDTDVERENNEIITDEIIIKTVETSDENKIENYLTKDKSSDGKNGEFSKEDNVLMKILDIDDSQNTLKNIDYYNKLSKSNLDLDIPKEPVIINKDNFNLDFIKNVKYMIKNSMEELNVKIYPKELGEITIKLISEVGVMKAEIKAASKETYNLLNSSLNEIKKTLENQNIRIQDVNIGIYNEDTTFFSGNKNSRNFNETQEVRNIKANINLDDEDFISEIINEGNVNFLA